MLTRFGGNHRNIVTLLATLAWENGLAKQYCLLFPWAECDLLRYWERMKIPNRDYSTHKWIVNQYRGIIDAIAFIHKPNMKNSKGEPLYGRHGDIKPENILWFKKDTGGLLVLSDLGLAAEHRDASRSNIPGHDIPNTPNYRPPECDMDGKAGFISRSFDIWTLGCLFLEFIIWTLCGWDERESFRSERFSPYINGIQKDIYFDVCRLPEKKDAYAFKIKDAVTRVSRRLLCFARLLTKNQRFASLHEHPDCSLFLHDLLDLIQSRLLIVESDEPRINRIKAAELLEEIERLANKCNDKSYCLDRCPRKTTHEPLDPVEVPLNRNAKRIIDAENMDSKLPQYPGRTRTATRRLGPPENGLRLGG
jgi:serine/threonine protein kinase